MIEIVVGTKNEAKLRGVKIAGRAVWPQTELAITGVSVPSGVSDQPMSDEEMIKGAHTRARNAADHMPQAALAVGLEGGIRQLPQGWFDLGWVCVIDRDSGKATYGATPAVYVPEPVRLFMQQSGLELSEAVAAVYKTDTISNRDCSGVITNGVLPCDRLYSIGVMSALSVQQHIADKESEANQNS